MSIVTYLILSPENEELMGEFEARIKLKGGKIVAIPYTFKTTTNQAPCRYSKLQRTVWKGEAKQIVNTRQTKKASNRPKAKTPGLPSEISITQLVYS